MNGDLTSLYTFASPGIDSDRMINLTGGSTRFDAVSDDLK